MIWIISNEQKNMKKHAHMKKSNGEIESNCKSWFFKNISPLYIDDFDGDDQSDNTLGMIEYMIVNECNNNKKMNWLWNQVPNPKNVCSFHPKGIYCFERISCGYTVLDVKTNLIQSFIWSDQMEQRH
jgi:hypothetical protein